MRGVVGRSVAGSGSWVGIGLVGGIWEEGGVGRRRWGSGEEVRVRWECVLGIGDRGS